MKQFLLDTSAFLFWTSDGKKLTPRARKLIEDPNNEILLSAISSWEIAIKYSLDKVVLPRPPGKFVPSEMAKHGIAGLAFEHSDALAVAALPGHHDDPFDRALIAQAIERDLPIITSDSQFDDYDVKVEW
ncbi:MAG TPA: type II toxin-antitoxin system VapC family toxin [Kofleriaceae bacterium]|jgi:PIN domain nuclease of toxin-antitoxin system|nr:type II toxin-antitoxin system VapC family toxin [Kofleriaceae bacterium]